MNERIKGLVDIIKSTEIRGRDVVIERILNGDPELTSNEKFIGEIRDHLSTCINREEFRSDYFFINKDLFIIEEACNCRTHFETVSDFDKNIEIIYLTYKDKEDFRVEDIIAEKYLQTIKRTK
jgi:hypothetical protein